MRMALVVPERLEEGRLGETSPVEGPLPSVEAVEEPRLIARMAPEETPWVGWEREKSPEACLESIS